MSEVTKATLVADFLEMARVATGNSNESRLAQTFFKTSLMGITEGRLLKDNPLMKPEEQPKIHNDYYGSMKDVLRCLTGTEFQSAADYDTMIGVVPRNEKGIALVLRRVAVDFKVISPKRLGLGL